MDAARAQLVPGGLSAAARQTVGLTPDQATTVTISFDPDSGIRAADGEDRQARRGRQEDVRPGPRASRLNVVEDNAYALVRPAPRAYRSLKLFDLGDDRVDSIAVAGEKESSASKRTSARRTPRSP